MSQRRFPERLIVQVIGYYPPHLGGSEKVAASLAKNLAERGQPVRVLAADVGYDGQPEPVVPNLDVRRLKTFDIAHTPFMPRLPLELWRLPKRSIVHVHLAQAFYPELVWLFAKLRRWPYVLHFHLDLQPTGILGRMFVAYKAIVFPRVIKSASAVIVFSEQQKRFIHEHYDVANERIATIPNGIGPEYFLPSRTSAYKKPFKLLYVGRLSAQKRVHILIDAMARLKVSATLLLVGDGEDREALERQAARLKLHNIQFEGFKKPAETLAYYKTADVFVLSSEREGMPLAVLEAMAAGLPVVGTNVPGTRELIGGSGVLVDHASGEAFAVALDQLLADPAELGRHAKLSRGAAARYSEASVTDAVQKLYREIEEQHR